MATDEPVLPALAVGRDVVARTLLTVVGTVLVSGLVYGLIPMRGDWGYLGAVVAVCAQLLLVPLTIRRARAIASSPVPIAAGIEAIVFLLCIVVFGFATSYVVLADEPNQMDGIATKIDAVYFSITTLATVGFGDIHATGQVARVVVSVQMLVDLVFIAVVVRLISTIARRRAVANQDGRPGPPA